MRILIVDDSKTDSLALRTAVQGPDNDVLVLHSGRDAVQQLTRHQPDVVLLDWSLPDLDGPEVTRHIRGLELGHYVYIMMVTGHDSIADLSFAFEAGVDDLVTKPFQPAELRARLQVAHRMLTLQSKLHDRIRELESAHRRLDISSAMRQPARPPSLHPVPGPSPLINGPRPSVLVPGTRPAPNGTRKMTPSGTRHIIADVPVWAAMPGQLADVLSKLVQITFQPAESPPAVGADWLAAVLPLADVQREIEMSVTIASDPASVAAMTMALFGESEGADMMADLMAELSNVGAGLLKTQFGTHGYAFTTGLPRAEPASAAISSALALATHSVFALTSELPTLVIGVTVRSKGRTVLKAQRLREGMVVSRDVFASGGQLLIRGGTRLTATAAEKLSKIVTGDVEVMNAEA